ncbi:MAG: hypothetical protein QFE16_17390 [Pseudomonadota bacterium]|nr:hypothetical protein [Pseudomonadota bacterium]
MKKFLWVGMIAWMASGCGELSYKRGASANDLELATKSCESAGDEKAVTQCLQGNGWVVRKLDDIDLFAAASVNPDHRNLVAGASVGTASSTVPAGHAASDKAGSENHDVNRTVSTEAIGQSLTPPPSTSPLDVYTVSSWWKTGAGRESLERDTGECVERLGEAHKPDHKTQQVSRGLVVCMHEKGWKALRQQ